ncbi:MAG TPA: TMEM175 family protein [Bacteroidia bacterium]|jgi:uncharacterized membrane protein|nr:TMEM175 family protein [Bacteroidia bacterium]
MNKSRLEAFSDGVFAIVITLLILDVRLPDVSYDKLPGAIRDVLPHLLAYVMSFIIIGLYWISHHISLNLVHKTTGAFLWMNILLLLLISFIPFPASLLGKYPFEPIPLILYGATLIATNLTGFSMLYHIYKRPHLTGSTLTRENFIYQRKVYIIINTFYLLAIGMAWISPALSYILYGLITAVLIIRNVRRVK